MAFLILTLIVVAIASFLLSYFFSFKIGSKDNDLDIYFKVFANTVGLILLVSLVTFFYVLRDRVLMKTEYLAYNSRKLEAEVQLLRRQVNPHFLFNTLNSIYLKCLQNTPDAAEMIVRLSEMLRYELEVSELETIALEKEIAFINNYISFEKRRLPKNVSLAYIEKVDNYDLHIPPNFILILIENCFKHGVLMNKECRIAIDLEVRERLLILKTENEIARKSASGTKQTGLRNLRKRLEYKYNDNFVLRHSVIDNKCTAYLKIKL
ncbi:MAG TPA: histidine kinase [Flavobacterium sp.]|nr:histidine kinase [Flavobacterium sp.]